MVDIILAFFAGLIVLIMMGFPWDIADYLRRNKRKNNNYSGKYTADGKQSDT